MELTPNTLLTATYKAQPFLEKAGVQFYQRSYLSIMGYYTSPASSKHHLACEGGLIIHSVNVTEILLDLTHRLGLTWKHERSPYLIGMMHDLCKAGLYITNEDKTYRTSPAACTTGHGEESLIRIIQCLGITLNEEEIMCIRWHMGAFDYERNWNLYGNAIRRYPNVLYTHLADMMASQILEK